MKVQYLCALLHGEALRQLDLLSADMENTDTSLYVDYLLKGLSWYFPLKFTYKAKVCNAPLYEKNMQL